MGKNPAGKRPSFAAWMALAPCSLVFPATRCRILSSAAALTRSLTRAGPSASSPYASGGSIVIAALPLDPPIAGKGEGRGRTRNGKEFAGEGKLEEREQKAERAMGVVTAVRTGAQLYASSGQLPRRGRGGTPHDARSTGETESPQTHHRSTLSRAGRTFWTHDASSGPDGPRRARHGPGGYCRPSGN